MEASQRYAALPSPERLERRLSMTSAAMRVLLGVAGVVVLPLAYPNLRTIRIGLTVYVVLATATLLLIRHGIGGQGRAVATGMIDLILLTALVHLLGSTHTVLLSIYVYAAVLNVLVVGPAVGQLMAAVGPTFYGLVLAAEQLGWLDAGGVGPVEALVSWGLVTALTIVATSVVGRLMGRIRDHENELRATNRALEETNVALETANAQLETLSQRDPLTDLYNRRHLGERLTYELLHVRRGREVAFLMVDLDGFKRVNDIHGHNVGDDLLRRIAEVLRETVRETDVVGRWGGDEIGVLLPDADLDDAAIAAQRLVERIGAVGRSFRHDAPVTASVGIAIARADDDAEALVHRADEATYRAKREGGNRFAVGRDAAPKATSAMRN